MQKKDDIKTRTNSDILTKALFWAIFLSSGALGLIYEILWMRFFALTMGSTIYAASAVTAAFMAGLALGAFAVGGLADRTRAPLSWYAAFEVAIGIFAITFLKAMPAIDSAACGVASLTHKFLLTAAVLAIPTVLMGATLPFISSAYVRIFTPRNNDFAVSFLYGINALGGVIGIFLSSFYLIYLLGVTRTTIAAACGNFLIAAIALLISSRYRDRQLQDQPGGEKKAEGPEQETHSRNYGYARFISYMAFFIVGFAALALEIIWTRLLVLIIGTSTYAFSIILIAFICGIPLGSIMIPLIIRRSPRMEAFGVVLMLLAIASFLTIPLISLSPYVFIKIFNSFHSDFSSFTFIQYLMCLIVLMLPTTLSGYAFTCAIGTIRTGTGTVGADVGRLYFFNTVGSVLGSISAPFFFIKNFGLQNSVLYLSLLYLITGITVTIASDSAKHMKILRVGLSVLVFLTLFYTCGSLDMSIVASGVHYHPEKFEGVSSFAQIEKMIRKSKQIYLAEGIDSTVGIYTQPGGTTFLKINGKTDASTGWYDMNTQLLLAHLPMMLCKHPDKIAIIGLGAGVTAGAVLKYSPQKVDCVEISPNVIDAARFFNKVNELDFTAPALSLIEEDALTFMKNSNVKYNVIISEPSNPWIAGIASLFTVEHFTNCRAHLEKGGVMCQWIQIYSMTYDDFIRILVTFHRVFPNCSVWLSSWGDALFLAADDDFEVDFNLLRARFEKSRSRAQLGLIEILSPESLLAHQILDNDAVKKIVASFPDTEVNSNDRQFLEFSAPVNYYRQDSEIIKSNLLKAQITGKLLLDQYLKEFAPTDRSFETVGRVFFKLKLYDLARGFFDKAAEKNPALWFLHLKYAEQRFGEKSFYEALNEIQVALFLAPEKMECYSAFLKVALEMHDYYAIIRVFEEGRKYFRGTDQYQYYLALGVAYEGIDRPLDSIVNYRKAIDLADDCSTAHKKIGLLYKNLNDRKLAIVHLEKAHKYSPNDPEVIDALAKLQGGK